MDFSLTPVQQQWVDKCRALSAEFTKRARAYDEKAAFPVENFKKLIDQNFHLLQVPKEYGGLNPEPAGNLGMTQFLIVEELARSCPTTSWDLVIHYHQCGVIARLGSHEQKKRIFRDVVEKQALTGSMGSEVNPTQFQQKNVKTHLTYDALFRPVEGGFLATGSKHFCSMGPVSGILSFWALAPGAKANGDGIVYCVVPKDAPGLTFEDTWNDVIGLRGTVSWSAHLKDVFIPWENVLGNPGDFVQHDPYTYECSHTAHLIGAAQGLFDYVVYFCKERDYLKSDDVLMYMLAEMDTAIQAARYSHYFAIWLWEQHRFEEAGLASIRALHTTKKVSLEMGSKAFDICGTRALFKFHPIERFWREIRASSLHTRDTQLMKLLVDGIFTDGRQFPKLKYGQKLNESVTWEKLGISRPDIKKEMVA